MKNLSLFIATFIQQTTVRAVDTEETAKYHCEEFYVAQGETVESIFFEYVASGGQSDVYKCESLRFRLNRLVGIRK